MKKRCVNSTTHLNYKNVNELIGNFNINSTPATTLFLAYSKQIRIYLGLKSIRVYPKAIMYVYNKIFKYFKIVDLNIYSNSISISVVKLPK